MSYIENTIAVLCGGAAGAVCRFKLNAAIMSGLTMAFPLGILCINVLGGFLMGLLQGAMKRSGKPFTVGYSLLGTGFLGGFTTFSTFSLDTFNLYHTGDSHARRSEHSPQCRNMHLRRVGWLPHRLPTHRRRIRKLYLPSQENRDKDPVIGRVFVLSLFPTLNLRNRGINRFEKAISTKAPKEIV